MVQKKQEKINNQTVSGTASTTEVKPNDKAVDDAVMANRKKEAYQLAIAMYQWVLSDSANTKGKAFIESHVTFKHTFGQSIMQGFGIAMGLFGYMAFTQFIGWLAKLLHL